MSLRPGFHSSEKQRPWVLPWEMDTVELRVRKTEKGLGAAMLSLLVVKVKVKSLSRVQLLRPVNCSPPSSSIHGILQAKKRSKTERKMTSPGRVADGASKTLLHAGVPRDCGHPSRGMVEMGEGMCISGKQLSRGLLGSSGLFLPGPQAAWNCHCTFSGERGLYKPGRL